MSTEDKKVDVNEKEVETTDNATKAKNKEKKERISTRKKAAGALGRLWKKGTKIARNHAVELKMAGMVAGGLVAGGTEANAQSYPDFQQNSMELHVNADGTTTLRRNGATASFQGARQAQSSPGQQADAKLMEAARYMRAHGMVIDAELSMGLRQEYLMTRNRTKLAPIACAAFFPEQPDQIYFIPTNFRGGLGTPCDRGNCMEWQRSPHAYKHISGNPYLGGGYGAPSAFLPFFQSQGVVVDYGYGAEAGYGRGGMVVVDGVSPVEDAVYRGAAVAHTVNRAARDVAHTIGVFKRVLGGPHHK